MIRIKYKGPGNYWVVKKGNKILFRGPYAMAYFHKIYFTTFPEEVK